MPELSSKDHWTGVYTQKAETAVSWFQTSPRQSLDWILPGTDPAATAIIDIGGGASRLADELLDRGFADVTVLDIADSALAQSRKRLGEHADRVRWIVADITAWSPTRQYDIWHDRAVFHFLVEPSGRAAYLAALNQATKSGSRVMIATFNLDGPERCSGLPVQRYSPQTLAETLGSDYAEIKSTNEVHNTPNGVTQHFQYSLYERR
jgi:SAM-dependent methyltransferase